MARLLLFLLLLRLAMPEGRAAEMPKAVTELLEFYCYDCHGYGKSEGGVDLDDLDFSQGFEPHGDLWEQVWRNVRTGMMPPAEGDQLTLDERKELLAWLEGQPLGIDRDKPDPGRVTVRRHNNTEYQNTIRDLVGVKYQTQNEFPPDDTGYGFDNIGDVLTISPLLAERYLEAARVIMSRAVPDEAGTLPKVEIWGPGFVNPQNKKETGRTIEFDRPQTVEAKRWLAEEGAYQISLTAQVADSSGPSDATATLALIINGSEVARQSVSQETGAISMALPDVLLTSRQHTFALQIIPKESPKPGQGSLAVAVDCLRITGPVGSEALAYPESYRRVITAANQPQGKAQWPESTRAVLRDFASKAWRRPVSADLLDRLCQLANETARAEDSFEAGIRQAGTAILASPRFLLRTETALAGEGGNHALIDEWSLASRLSYFLWSSLPDNELRELAARGKLRAQLDQQVTRMLQDRKANRMIANFVGQWLQARDVQTIAMQPHIILKKRFLIAQKTFSRRLRADMRLETEALFRHVLQGDLPATDLVAGDYTFLNQRLADFYGISGVTGNRLRKVSGHRGGLLTQGTFLVVTSNPTRTSPVKRGLFVLENLLGTPPPPAPPDIPTLEEATRGRPGMTMREKLAVHREKPDCRSCHARMDPIGLAFENFTALGNYREKDGGKTIDAEGQLATGEKFAGVEELKQLLANERRADFERCLTEKLLTYALGRGVEYYDAPAIDTIVERMGKKDGSLQEALRAVIDSVPFQMRRID